MAKQATMITANTAKNYWLVAILAVVFVLGGAYAYWFFNNYHKVELPPSYTPTTEVLQNRYFAATKLLGDEHSQTLTGKEGQAKFTQIISQDDDQAKKNALVIYQVSSSNRQDLVAMMNWVERGGHLIVASQATKQKEADADHAEYLGKQNPLLLQLGIDYQDTDDYSVNLNNRAVPARFDNGQTFVVSASPSGGQGRFELAEFLQKYPNARPYDYDWFFKDSQGVYQLKPNNHSGLTTEQYNQLLDTLNKEQHVNLLSVNRAFVDVAFGQGRLTVLSDRDMFTNPKAYNIVPSPYDDTTKQAPKSSSRTWALLTGTDTDESPKKHHYVDNLIMADNAYFLQYLTADRYVSFLPQIESDDFFSLLWRYLPYSLLGLLFTVITLLFALPKRFGALKVYQTDSGRNIFGFFAHVGQYLWYSDQAHSLMTANRHALIHTIMAKELLHDDDPRTLMDAVAKKTGLSLGLIDDALYQTWQTDNEFLRISRSFAQVAKFYQD